MLAAVRSRAQSGALPTDSSEHSGQRPGWAEARKQDAAADKPVSMLVTQSVPSRR